MDNSASSKPQTGAPQQAGRGRALAYTLVAFAAVGAIGLANAFLRPSSPAPAAVTGVSPESSTVTAPAGALRPAAGSLIEWDQEKLPGEAVYAVDGLLLSLSSRPTDANPTTVLRITGPKGETFDVVGEMGASSAHAELAVGQIDPSTSSTFD